ncbi:MAG: glycosyltransferase, partial [bacterium]|nr:glycosyltransferase [bacterium]
MGQTLSVVIGAYNARSSIAECLESVERQRNGRVIEVIVVDNSTDGTADIAATNFDHVQVIRSPESNFIPELWEVGINRSTGDIIVITTAHCIPAGDWIDSILKAHEKPFAGIGGAIENDGTSGLTDWAIYFCRYSRYMLPFGEREVDDIPGDNASYKRAAMEGCKEERRNGFWEPTVHAQFAREGLRLL